MTGRTGGGCRALTTPQAWAQETGRFRAGDPPDPPRWKATLRCALNKSREFRLLLDGPRGSPAQPFRVYELCEEPPGGAGTGGLWGGFGYPPKSQHPTRTRRPTSVPHPKAPAPHEVPAPQQPPHPTRTQRPQRLGPPQGTRLLRSLSVPRVPRPLNIHPGTPQLPWHFPAPLSLADGGEEDDYGCSGEEDVSQVSGGLRVGGSPNRGHLRGPRGDPVTPTLPCSSRR